jgi:hypothetical protein
LGELTEIAPADASVAAVDVNMHFYSNMVAKISFVLGCLCCVFLPACSTIDSRIQEKGAVYSSLSSRDQALVKSGTIREGLPEEAVYIAWGAPAQVRSGSRYGHPYAAWVYTTLKTVFVNDFYYPRFYRFGLYRYSGYWGYPFWGPDAYPYPDDFVSVEVPYKTAFFEGNRCTGWEFIQE